jgi:hypothetical protein
MTPGVFLLLRFEYIVVTTKKMGSNLVYVGECKCGLF